MSRNPHRWRHLALQEVFGLTSPIHIAGTTVLMPFIQSDFGLTRSMVAWVFIAYLLGTASFMLAAAYLGNAIGRRKLVVIGISIDLVTQLGIFLVPSFIGLIFLRLIGGIGNSMTVANIAPITVSAFPDHQRGQVLGLMNLGVGMGILVSTPLAGLVADTIGWRFLFLGTAIAYTGLLIGVLTMMKESTELSGEKISYKRFDYAGLALVSSTLIFLTVGLQRIGDSSTLFLGLIMIGMAVVAAGGFIFVEKRAKYALIPLDLFREIEFSSAVGRLFSFFALRSSLSFLMPFYFVQGLGWSGALAGSMIIALNFGHPVVAPLAGILSDKFGSFKVILSAFLIAAFACVSLMFLGQNPNVFHVAASLFFAGVAFGLFLPPNQKTIYDGVPREQMSLAPGILVLAGTSSGVLGSATAAVLLGAFESTSITEAYQQSVLFLLAIFVGINILLFLANSGKQKSKG